MDVLLWKCMTDRLLSDVCLQLNLFHHFLPLCQLQQISTRCILSEMSAILNDWSQPYPRKNWSKLSWLLKSYFKTLSETRVNLKYWSKRLLLNRKTHFITTVCPPSSPWFYFGDYVFLLFESNMNTGLYKNSIFRVPQ